MKMTEHDRLEAIKRTPQYLKYQETLRKSSKETDPKKKLALFKKVRFPWRDDIEFQYLIFSELPGFDEIKQGLIKHLEREAVVMVTENKWPRGKKGPVPNATWTWNKNRLFVRLSIDLNKSERELTKRFKEIIKTVKEELKQDISQGRTTRKKRDYDPWDVYELCKKGLSKNKIARMKSGENYPPGKKNSPIYNPELSAPDKRVDRAYNQAVKMIQAMSAEIESWYSKNLP